MRKATLILAAAAVAGTLLWAGTANAEHSRSRVTLHVGSAPVAYVGHHGHHGPHFGHGYGGPVVVYRPAPRYPAYPAPCHGPVVIPRSHHGYHGSYYSRPHIDYYGKGLGISIGF